MNGTRKPNIILILLIAIAVVVAMPMATYANEDQAYVYKYTKSEDFSNNDVIYANGSGSTPAYLRYVTGPEGQQQYGGYCADFESNVTAGSMYSRTTLDKSGYFSASVKGHLRAILANSVPVKTLETLKAESGVSSLDYGEAVAATQWAIWAYTNPSSPEIAVPSKDGTSDKEKAAYYLYNLAPIGGGYATEPILVNITSYQDGSNLVFDYSGSINVMEMQNKVITVTDGSGNPLDYTDNYYNVIVDVSGLTKDQEVNIKIEGKQILAADAYFYNPEGGRMASQSLISWFVGESSIAGTATGFYDVDKEFTELQLTAGKEMVGRDIDVSVDNFQFVVKDSEKNIVATGTTDAAGKIVFTPITYTKAQAGKTYTYTMYEEKGNNPGIEYDASVKTVKVTVGYADGKVTAKATYDEAGMTFVNKYTTEDADIQLKVYKKLEGNKTLIKDMFQFTKVECDANGIPLEGKEETTAGNGADGSVVFDAMTYENEGTHYYLIKEVNGGKRIDGITYDGMELVVKVTVTDNKYGKLVAAAEYPADITFNNRYTADPDIAAFGGDKYLKGRPMIEGEFAFVVKDADGRIVERVTNGADGTFNFAPITFNTAGTYVFTVAEEIGEAEGVTYDNTIHEVIVTVTDDGKGHLHAVVTEPEGGVVFRNEYVGPGQITVNKTFRFNDAEQASELEFEVGLFTDEACTVKALYADGTEVENQIIRMNGETTAAVTFTGLEYGTYYVAEIGADGAALEEGVVTGRLLETAYKQTVAYENKEQILTPEAKEGEANIVNDFYTEEYYLQGQIKVIKQVVIGGLPTAIDATFFVALFEDPELTVRVSDVKMIELIGQHEGFAVFEGLEINKTYYVAETDLYGNPIAAGEYGIKEIEILNGAVEIVPMEEPVVHEAVVINYYEEDYGIDLTDGDLLIEIEEEVVNEEEKEQIVKETEKKDKAVKTGDDFNFVMVFAMMMLALAGMAVAVFVRKKAE